MKPKLYDEVQLVRAVPTANLEVGDRAILIEYLEHPSGGEMGAVLELSQSMERQHYVVTVPAGAIAPADAVSDSLVGSKEALPNRPIWVSVYQQVLSIFGRLMTFLGLGHQDG